MTEPMNLNMIKHYLKGCNGTNGYHYRTNQKAVYTDGVMYYLEKAEAQWLYDIIEREVFQVLRKKNEPDKYYLTFTAKNREGLMVLKDYRGNEIWKRFIPFTDAPFGEMLFYCGWDGQRLITCVPSED